MPVRSKPGAPSGASKYAGASGRADDKALSWGDVDGGVLHDAVAFVTGSGDAVLFGVSSDGGALTCQFFHEGERKAFFYPSTEGAENALRAAIEAAR